MVLFIDRPAWPVQWENLRGKFKKRKVSTKPDEITSRNMGAGKQYSSVDFLGGFIKLQLMYPISTLLFLVVEKASRVHKLTCYIPTIVEQLLKLP